MLVSVSSTVVDRGGGRFVCCWTYILELKMNLLIYSLPASARLSFCQAYNLIWVRRLYSVLTSHLLWESKAEGYLLYWWTLSDGGGPKKKDSPIPRPAPFLVAILQATTTGQGPGKKASYREDVFCIVEMYTFVQAAFQWFKWGCAFKQISLSLHGTSE